MNLLTIGISLNNYTGALQSNGILTINPVNGARLQTAVCNGSMRSIKRRGIAIFRWREGSIMYIFKTWHQFLPLALTLAGFYIVQYYEQNAIRTWDVDVVFMVFQFFAVITYPAMLTAGLMYQKYMTSTDTPQIIQPQQEIPHSIPNMGELHQYAQEVKQVTTRKDIQFAKTLLAMRTLADDDSKVDLREDTWKDHFGGRSAYVEARSRFEQAKGFARKDARVNSPFIVTDWRVVQLVAQGETLR